MSENLELVLSIFAGWDGCGKGSGVDVGGMRTHGANLFHVGDSKVTRFVLYWDTDHALAELGLRE